MNKNKILILILLFILLIMLSYKNHYIEKMDTQYTNKVYCFWTGKNKMSQQRKDCLQNLQTTTDAMVILITPYNLPDYILPQYPLHEAYSYLSETHKADYFRSYDMNFYGGGLY